METAGELIVIDSQHLLHPPEQKGRKPKRQQGTAVRKDASPRNLIELKNKIKLIIIKLNPASECGRGDSGPSLLEEESLSYL